jgi:hypothetical protein
MLLRRSKLPKFLRSDRNAPPFRVGRLRLLAGLSLLFCGAVLAQELSVEEPLSPDAASPTAEATITETPESTPVETPTEAVAETPTTTPESTLSPTATATEEASATEEATATATEEVTATPEPSPTPSPTLVPPINAPRAVGRTVVVLMAGVTWDDWAAIVTRQSASTPGLRRLLEESALAAARLPGTDAKYFDAGSPNEVQPSATILRTAGILSSGRALSEPLPPALAATLGLREPTSRALPGWENAPAAVAWARRTGQSPQPGSLVNLGWGVAQNQSQKLPAPGDALVSSNTLLGVLGAAAHAARGRTWALGNADISRESGAPLREWALSVADNNGAVDSGEVSSRLLARDLSSPYGVRTDVAALVKSLDSALGDMRTAVVSVEWGDTRRAALYAPWCAPQIGAAYRREALARGDAFLRAVMSRLADRDRLLLVCVPELNSPKPQWLPLAYWQPRRGQGALLRVRGASEQRGAIPLESITPLLIYRFGLNNVAAGTPDLNLGHLSAMAEPGGSPSPSTQRLTRLLAMQGGLDWLHDARPWAHNVLVLLLVAALGLSLWILPRDNVADVLSPERARLRRQIRSWARDGWIALMIVPFVLWLIGLCLEISWRSGVFSSLSNVSGTASSGSLVAIGLMFVSLAIVGVLAAVGGGFASNRLNRVPLGVVWFALTVLGLWFGGFVLPWNEALHTSWRGDVWQSTLRLGDVWALLLVSATMLGVAGLTQPRPRRRSVLDDEETPHIRTAEVRRVINLRPVTIWMLAVLWLLWSGGNGAVLFVALVGFVALSVRLWLVRLERRERLRRRRWTLAFAAAVLFLLGWQRGGGWWLQSTLSEWWPQWQMMWQSGWWRWALAAILGAAFWLSTGARPILREYLQENYSTRLLLAATAVASIPALLLFGPMGPVLLSLYPAGAVMYDLLYARTLSSPAAARRRFGRRTSDLTASDAAD